MKDLRRFWYFNKQFLGDMLKSDDAFAMVTLTLNNLALMYKRQANLPIALTQIKDCLSLEQAKYSMLLQADSDEEDLARASTAVASSMTNLCTIYSELGKHKVALKYGI